MNIITLRKIITLLKNLLCTFLYCSGFLWIYNKFEHHSKKNYIIILVYHNIINKKLFSKHIEYFKQKYDIISLDEAIKLLSSDKNFNQKLVITFDDGYKNIYSVAKNITQNKIPICIFLSTYYVESGDIFWWDTFRTIAQKNKKLAHRLSRIEQTVIEMPQEERDSKIEELLQLYAPDRKIYDFKSEVLPLSWTDVEKMRAYNVEFESHCHHHYILTNARLNTIKENIESSKGLIKKKLSLNIKHFAYPDGHYNKKIIQILKEYGFVSAVTAKYGINTKNTDLFELYRIGISDEDWIPTVKVKISGLGRIVNSLDRLIYRLILRDKKIYRTIGKIMNIVWISKLTKDSLHKTSRLKMSDALIKRGYNVTLYVAKKFGEKNFDSDNVVCIPTIHIPIFSGLFYGLIIFFYFPFFLSKKNIDVIIVDFTKVWLPFIMSLKMLNIPIILDIRTLPVDKNESFWFRVSIYLSRYVADGVTTITPELNTILRDFYNLKTKKVGIWSSGVSIQDFNKTDKKMPIRIRSTDHKFTLIYHGGYSPTRGIENLIKAIGELDPTLKNKIRLLIIGMTTDLIKDLSKISEKEGVKEQVKVLPPVEYSKIPRYLRIADVGIFCLPPEYIWWRVSAPLKTLEYLAAEKPIIVTNIPFHRKIFDKGNCGILLESGDPKVIAKGISYLYKNQKELKKMGVKGRKIVEKFYTWDCMAQEFEDFLKNFKSSGLK